jgi:site-specific recombinase XerD
MSVAPLSFAEALAAFEQHLFGRGRSQATAHTYASALGVFATFYREGLQKPGPYVSRLQATDLHAFIDYLRRDRRLRAASMNRYVAALHAFSLFALAQQWIKRDLACDLKTYRLQVPAAPSTLTPAQVRRLIASVDLNGRNGLRNLAVLQLLLQTGVRVSELAALSVGDLTLHKSSGEVRIRGDKGYVERLLPLNTSARRALSEYLASRGRPPANAPLFLSERRQRLTVVSIQHLVKKYLACASREDLSTHDLRHHFASQLYERTGKLTAVQQALGHRNIATTARYAQVTTQEIQAALESSPDNLNGNGERR